jgi:ketosteroid isomerase-like protein
MGMDAETAAHRWAATWSQAWTQRDAEAIAELYADTVVYRSPAFGPPELGLAGVRRYLNEQVPIAADRECRVGQPIVSGDRAAVEWWASWTGQGQDLWSAGVTMLRFDAQGQVIEHRDYYHPVVQRQPLDEADS